MKPTSLRTLGFAVPTFALVVALHLAEQATPGEALDGAVSAAWFVAFFVIGTWVAQRTGFAREGGRALAHLLDGALASMGAWAFLWALWAVPFTASLRLESGAVFTINTLTMVVAAFAAARIPALHGQRGLFA